jgi:hypothetical protein
VTPNCLPIDSCERPNRSNSNTSAIWFSVSFPLPNSVPGTCFQLCPRFISETPLCAIPKRLAISRCGTRFATSRTAQLSTTARASSAILRVAPTLPASMISDARSLRHLRRTRNHGPVATPGWRADVDVTRPWSQKRGRVRGGRVTESPGAAQQRREAATRKPHRGSRNDDARLTSKGRRAWVIRRSR